MMKEKIKNLFLLWVILILAGMGMSFSTDWEFVPPVLVWGGLLGLSLAYLVVQSKKE
jgi:hypothetical protein